VKVHKFYNEGQKILKMIEEQHGYQKSLWMREKDVNKAFLLGNYWKNCFSCNDMAYHAEFAGSSRKFPLNH
jgi:hypothetical protein